MSEQTELDFADGVATFVDDSGYIHIVVDPNSNLGKTNGGQGKNTMVATTRGFMPVKTGKKVIRINLNAIA